MIFTCEGIGTYVHVKDGIIESRGLYILLLLLLLGWIFYIIYTPRIVTTSVTFYSFKLKAEYEICARKWICAECVLGPIFTLMHSQLYVRMHMYVMHLQTYRCEALPSIQSDAYVHTYVCDALLLCTDLQMWMNARETMAVVLNCVSIQTAPIHAVATMATHSKMMLLLVKVNIRTLQLILPVYKP